VRLTVAVKDVERVYLDRHGSGWEGGARCWHSHAGTALGMDERRKGVDWVRDVN
jgi:hypothetical protein